MIITKHKAANADALGTRICQILDSPSIQIEPKIIHHPKYFMSNVAWKTCFRAMPNRMDAMSVNKIQKAINVDIP